MSALAEKKPADSTSDPAGLTPAGERAGEKTTMLTQRYDPVGLVPTVKQPIDFGILSTRDHLYFGTS